MPRPTRPACAQCGLRLEEVGGVRIVATAEGLRVNPACDAEGYLRWLCQRCAHAVYPACGSIRIPLGADILHDDGTTGHAVLLPIGNKYCTNPACVHRMNPS